MSDASTSRERAARGEVQSTGIADCELSMEFDDVHLLGILHKTPMAIARLTGAITRYHPGLVAVETQPEVVASYHPDIYDPRWPPEHEVEAAAFATDHIDDLAITGIDSEDWQVDMDVLAEVDAEVFADMGLIDAHDDLTRSAYYDLDPSMIRRWRSETKRREPTLFDRVLKRRDERMAGHLRALLQADEFDTIIATVGVQHLTGILDLLRDPSLIPQDLIEFPPVCFYHTI